MAEVKNYLLGYGERLTEKLDPPKTRPDKKDWYSFAEAQSRLAPRIATVAENVEALPAAACPHDETVAVITMHPSYLAKSYFPSELLRSVGLEPVGSRARKIVPDKGAKVPRKKAPEERTTAKAIETPTAEIFVSGTRRSFRRWATSVGTWSDTRTGADELVRVENVYFAAPAERLQTVRSPKETPLLEVVLHAPDDYVIEGFRDYMRTFDVRVDLDRRFQIEGLCFLGVRVPKALHIEMAKFSFLRVAREMPRLRELRPASPIRSFGVRGFSCELPTAGPLNQDLRVAVFDGGIPDGAGLKPWVSRKRTPKLGSADPDSQAHGLGVTSAVLFGPIQDGEPLPRPFAAVDHYRVIDDKTQDPEGNYYDVLERITSILSQNKYDFVNLSLGPEVAFDDNEVHLWTLKLDQLFSDGKTFVTVAAGNTGEGDLLSGVARIQSPSDAVNVLGVGASDSLGAKWKRAPYSSLGPGRSPGVMKPDVVAFGGAVKEPFWILDSMTEGQTVPIAGTSFASPLALRTAIGVRTYLGSIVEPISLKALLIHHGDDGDHHCHEVGWGRIPSDVEALITCGPGTAHVLYQGTLEPGKYLRARIPVPHGPIKGKVMITATFCYATETDPQDSVNYTRAGLEVRFRPDRTKRTKRNGKTPLHPDTMPFFQLKELYNTEELRRDAHQWETCVKRTRGFLGTTLNDPVFDIHYNARKGGHLYTSAKPIPYALVVTVHAKGVPDLYDRISQRYRTQLEALRPVIQVPIRAS